MPSDATLMYNPFTNNFDFVGGGGGGSVISKWIDEYGLFDAKVGTGYFITAVSVTTMPPTPLQGDRIAFYIDTTDLLIIECNTGQYIQIGAEISVINGLAQGQVVGSTLELVYRTVDSTWHTIAVNGSWIVT